MIGIMSVTFMYLLLKACLMVSDFAESPDTLAVLEGNSSDDFGVVHSDDWGGVHSDVFDDALADVSAGADGVKPVSPESVSCVFADVDGVDSVSSESVLEDNQSSSLSSSESEKRGLFGPIILFTGS